MLELDMEAGIGGGRMVHHAGRATYQDILDAPAEKVAELIDGELFLSPRPAVPHAVAASFLGSDLIDAFWRGRSGPGGWIILDEPELHFDDRETILVPDLAGWRRERMPTPPQSAGIELPPDWVCEVLSPGTARLDRYKKMPLYAAQGVPWLWLIDPLAKTLEVHRREPEGYLFLGVFTGDVRVRAPPFDAIELSLGPLWGDAPAPAAPQP